MAQGLQIFCLGILVLKRSLWILFKDLFHMLKLCMSYLEIVKMSWTSQLSFKCERKTSPPTLCFTHPLILKWGGSSYDLWQHCHAKGYFDICEWWVFKLDIFTWQFGTKLENCHLEKKPWKQGGSSFPNHLSCKAMAYFGGLG